MIMRIILLLALLSISFATAETQAKILQYNSTPITISSSTIGHLATQGNNLDPNVLKLGLEAYAKLHAEGYDQQQVLTIVDYSKPSTEPRLWVIDLKDLQVIYHTLVAHGQNSGWNVPTSFSDNPRSLESSIGVYLTGSAFFGRHGEALHLNGLDRGYNDTAAARAIEIHAADYVSAEFARLHGRLGRSWGCLAVNPQVALPIINEIKNGTVLFAYYPDRSWLSHSVFLHS